MAEVGVIGVHEATTVGPLTIVVLQVVVVQLLPELALLGVQLATATLVVVFGVGHVVVV